MPLSAEARNRLLEQQAAVVTALTGRGDPPAGFDQYRFRAAAASLMRKRVRTAARAWPDLARSLAGTFHELFVVYAAAAPLARDADPLVDGWAFARWLANRDELPEAARLQALAIDLRYRRRANGIVKKKGLACKSTRLRQPARLIVAVRLPWLNEYWFRIRLGRRHDTFHSAALDPPLRH